MPVLFFLLLMIVTFGVSLYFLRPTKTESTVQQRLEDIQDRRKEDSGQSILKAEGYSRNAEYSAIIREIPGAIGTLNLIRQAGQSWTVGSVMGISLLATVSHRVDCIFFLARRVPGGHCGSRAGSIPYIVLVIMREQRFRKCDQLLPEAIDLMARGLRAGHALTAVLEMVGSETADPIASEFRRLAEEHSLGVTLRDATMNLVARLPRDDMRFSGYRDPLAERDGRQPGGHSRQDSSCCSRTCAITRSTEDLHGAGPRHGWILCLMPFIMFGLLSLLNWDFEKLLFTEELGRKMVYFGLGLMVLGVLAIRKIIDVKV